MTETKSFFLAHGAVPSDGLMPRKAMPLDRDTPRGKVPNTAAALRTFLDSHPDDAVRDLSEEGLIRYEGLLFAARLVRRLRRTHGLTQTELAKRSGVPQPTISQIERMELRDGPTVATLARLAHGAGESLPNPE